MINMVLVIDTVTEINIMAMVVMVDVMEIPMTTLEDDTVAQEVVDTATDTEIDMGIGTAVVIIINDIILYE